MKIEEKLISKSIEAFTLAIEVYNKPTIKYRVEGFAFFICNAWELLLKAYIIKTKGKDAIYYKDKPDRTISLELAVKEIFTNEKDPLRLNLERIIELRNTATHYIIEEYEMLYAPLFQACVNNFSDKLESMFNVSINDYIKTPFLTLITYKNQLNDMEILGNYGKEIFDKYNSLKSGILQILDNTSNDKFAIGIQLDMRLIKKGDADLTVKIDSSSAVPAHIIKDIKDVNTYYPYNEKRAIEKINYILSCSSVDVVLNKYSFRLIREYFKLETNEKYCYHLTLDSSPRKLYSQSLIDFFINEIKKDHDIIIKLKDKIKRSTPGAKEF